MLSIYSAWYSVDQMGFKWREALDNWLHFLRDSGEVVIAVNTSTDGTYEKVTEYLKSRHPDYPRVRTVVVQCDIPYTNSAFDGMIKAFALSHCTQPYCVLLDCDELMVPSLRKHWHALGVELEKQAQIEPGRRIDAFLVPTVDLFHDEKHYKSGDQLGAKWYIHRNDPNITRGVVKWAYREDGSFDISKSDSCELIYKDTDDLVRASTIIVALPHYIQMMHLSNGEVPFVVHTGWLDKQQRLKQSEFWAPVWRARDNSDKVQPTTLAELEKVQYYRHSLPSWKTL